jgi:hypothetical protein
MMVNEMVNGEMMRYDDMVNDVVRWCGSKYILLNDMVQ